MIPLIVPAIVTNNLLAVDVICKGYDLLWFRGIMNRVTDAYAYAYDMIFTQDITIRITSPYISNDETRRTIKYSYTRCVLQ